MITLTNTHSHPNAASGACTQIHTSMCKNMALTLLGLEVQILTGATHVKMYKLLAVPGGLNPLRTDVDERVVNFSSPEKYDS